MKHRTNAAGWIQLAPAVGLFLQLTMPARALDIPFTKWVISDSAPGASSIFATDVDGDGDIDAVAVSGAGLVWYVNTGGLPPRFLERLISPTPAGARSVCAADVDGDGDTDVISYSPIDEKIAWYENDSASPPAFIERLISSPVLGLTSVIAMDVDGDGNIDLISASDRDDTIAWYESDGASPPDFTKHVVSADSKGAASIFATDLDRDGDIDIISASGDDDTVAWYESDGGSTPGFTKHVISTDVNDVASVFAIDMDSDGDIDIVSSALRDQIAWYESDGHSPPSFTRWRIPGSALISSSVFAADVDGDGDVDILSASRFPDRVSWHENEFRFNPTFSEHTIFRGVGRASSVFAIDVDGDGDTDVLATSLIDDNITWYENLSPCGFDSDCDGDVDVSDFAAFQLAFTGLP